MHIIFLLLFSFVELVKSRLYVSWLFKPRNKDILLFSPNEVKVAQSCLTVWDSMDYTVHGILQARILESVAFPFSRGSSQPRDQIQVSHIAGRFFTNLTTREAQE